MKPHVTFTAIAVATLAIPVLASERPHLTSGSVDHPIVIDGHEDDWAGGLQPFGEQLFSVQAENDGTFLYLHLDASSPDVRREIVRTGLTVWFDPKGGTKKVFGIRYPVVEEPFDQGERGGHAGDGRRGGGEGRARTGEQPPAIAENPEPVDRVDILGPAKDDARSFTRDHLQGIEVATRTNGDVLVYELKVPLTANSDHPYAIGVAPGQTVGIGFETPKVTPPQFHGGRGGFGGGSYGSGGYGGHHSGDGGGHSRGEGAGTQQPKPLKAWGTLTLR